MVGVYVFGVFCTKGAGIIIPNKPDGSFGETFNPPVLDKPLFKDFPSFRSHLTRKRVSTSGVVKAINTFFADPKDSEKVSDVIDRFEKGFQYLIKYEDL